MRNCFHHIPATLLIVVIVACAQMGVAQPGWSQSELDLNPEKAITQFHLDHWAREDGLPQRTVNAVIQARSGYIWLGTQEGLVRFDGRSFTVFNKQNSDLRNDHIKALHEHRDGSIWMGSMGGGVSRFQDGHFTTFTTQQGLPSNLVSAIATTDDGALWVGTFDGGLARYHQGQFQTFTAEDGLPGNTVTALRPGTDGALWVGTSGGLSRYSEGAFTTLTVEDGLPSNDVTQIARAREGGLWIGTSNSGVVRYVEGQFTAYTEADGLSANAVQALHEDRAGALWVGTEYGGLNRLVDGRFTSLTTKEGLAHDVIEALMQDREGSLWIGTAGGGLNRLRDGKFATYTTLEGLGNNQVYTVTEDAAGRIWVGTEGGGVSRLEADTVAATYTTADGLSSNVVTALYGSRDGGVWIGTLRNGLNRYVDGRITRFTSSDGLPSDEIYGLYEDAAGTLWMATGEGLVRYRDGTFATLTTEDGLTSNLITTVTEGAEGTLWVGTFDGGLHELREETVVAHYGAEDGLESNTILDLHVDEAGRLWIGTQEGGLHRLTDGQLVSYTASDGLFDETILTVLEDEQGHLWMSTNRGLFTVPRAQLNDFAEGRREAITPVTYDESDGLRSIEFNGGVQPAGWVARDGRLWFPSTHGVVAADPDRLPQNTLPPPVVIEDLRTEDTSVSLAEPIELAPGQDKVEFAYAGLSFHAPQRVTYRYQLSGVDDGWVEAGTRQEAFYTNLAPGDYTFRVMARNGDGTWSAEPATVHFRLESFFYQTAWFYLLCGLGVIGLGVAGYRLRVQHLKRRQDMLEHQVAARTQELQAEKERTEEALQEAEQQRRQVQQAKEVIEEQADQLREMNRIKTRFFNNISHEFRTPLTLNIGPLENALTGMYGPIEGKLRRHLEMVLRNSRRLLRLINQLLDLSKIDSGGMELSRQRGNLAQLLEGIVMSFSYFTEEKDIDVQLEVERPEMIHIYDADALEKVFFNLFSNAVKFTPEGGAVDVVLASRDDADGQADGAYEVRIKDTGPGIPDEDLPHIFDRFRQVDGTVSRIQEGTGIGLALVKELIELHDGTIRVESEVDVGTEFTITLPKTDDERLAPDETDTQRDAPSDTLRDPVSQGPMVEMAVFDEPDTEDRVISDGATVDAGEVAVQPSDDVPTLLVVDDNADIRRYMVDCLDDRYHVVLAEDGREALDIMRTARPNLVISDVMMPGLNGFELCRRVRAEERLRHIPIILLTAKASIDDKLEGLEVGADDYLHKPFDARELRVRVRNLLRLREHQQSLQRLNAELQEANAELERAGALKTEFLRLAAHDMKNPLNGIREFAKILTEELGDDSSLVEITEMIHTSADKMLRMVTQLLESAALEDGDFEFEYEPIDLRKVAVEVADQNRKQAERKGQKLALDLPDDAACTVQADPTWIEEAMDNLVSNAVKYSPQGKPIRIAVTTVRNEIRFVVEDEGPGLTEEDMEKLFGKFQRLSATPTGDESSTGLGLSIVKQIVEKHEGRVWAESEYGTGSTFFMALPRYQSKVEMN